MSTSISIALTGAVLSGCSGDDNGCAAQVSPQIAIEGFDTAAPEVELAFRNALYGAAVGLLQAHGPGDDAPLDPAARQVRDALLAYGADPSTLNDLPHSAGMTLAETERFRSEVTEQGAIAAQAAAAMAQVRAAVAAERLPLPAEDLAEWGEQIEADVRTTVRTALGDDPTYRAGIELAHPDYDGDPGSVVLTHQGMAGIVNHIGLKVGTQVRLSILASCDEE